jgi:glutathione synthase/RimK-type ligase-like ATP-grasp enzyme
MVESTERGLFTNRISLDEIEKYPQKITAAPGIFQPYIEKEHELRVTIVDEIIFAARIESQAHPDTQTDWRRNPGAIAYTEVTLPTEVSQRLKTFHRNQGLVYAAYDFIVTPEGRYVFLEVNSVGQWLWLEETAGLRIFCSDCRRPSERSA